MMLLASKDFKLYLLFIFFLFILSKSFPRKNNIDRSKCIRGHQFKKFLIRNSWSCSFQIDIEISSIHIFAKRKKQDGKKLCPFKVIIRIFSATVENIVNYRFELFNKGLFAHFTLLSMRKDTHLNDCSFWWFMR